MKNKTSKSKRALAKAIEQAPEADKAAREADNARLREALAVCGKHNSTCASLWPVVGVRPCDCPMRALAATKEADRG